MKIRRVTLEVEVPYHISAEHVLGAIQFGLDETGGLTPFRHQAQIMTDEESKNTQIGTWFAPR